MKKSLLLGLTLVVLVPSLLFAGAQVEKASTSENMPVLVIWDQFFPESQNKLMDSFISEFEASHNVKIERTLYDTESLRTTLRSALASGTGPDIFYYDAGPAFLGSFASAGLVKDLTADYEKNGWNDTLSDWATERVTYSGKKYGVPHEIEFTCCYVNKAILKNIGMEDAIIKLGGSENLYTFKDFSVYEAILQKSKEAGYIPLSLGMRNPGYGGHLYSYLVTLTAGKEKIDNILFGDGTWEDPDVVNALELFQEWNEKGYYTPSPNSVSYDETNALFFTGKTATNPSGTWLIADILDQVSNPDDFIIVMLPAEKEGLPVAAGSGIGSCFAISASSKEPELAVEFLNYITNKANSERWINEGQIIPANVTIDLSTIELPFMMKQAIEGASLNHAYNLDVVMPSAWNDAMMNGIQALINGSDTPASVSSKMQKAWADAKAAGDIWKAK